MSEYSGIHNDDPFWDNLMNADPEPPNHLTINTPVIVIVIGFVMIIAAVIYALVEM